MSESGMSRAIVALRPLTRTDLRLIAPWFEDPDSDRFLGGPEWPAAMLTDGDRSVGTTFRGAVQTGAYRYLALADGGPVGYVDWGVFDRCTVYGGEGPEGPIITGTLAVVTGSIAFVIDPALRRRGLERAMVASLLGQPELDLVELFEAGVEPTNTASRKCLEAAGFGLRSEQPDFEGMLYYRAWRADVGSGATLSA